MMVIPFQINPQEFSLFVALDPEGVGRIEEHDPAQVDMRKLPRVWQGLRLCIILIGYATADDMAHVMEMLSSGGDSEKALKYLSRGFMFKPEAGDHDGPYLNLSAETDGPKV